MSRSTPAERLEPVLAWIDAHRDAAIATLQRFCRQPSISAQNKGMQDMAELVADSLRELGAETSLVPTQGFPVVVGRLASERTRRLVIYDHYDVQPPEPLEAWSVPPFEATLRDDRLYARGVADNKGNLVARLWAVRAWRAAHGTLPCGVTFLVEGEEEIGSPSLGAFARIHQDLLRADGCLWEAGARNEQGTITITAGLKGVLSVELRVQTVAYDLHSSYAPLAPNAAWRLIEALGSLHEPSGRVRIPGFYDAVRPPTEGERRLMARFPIEASLLRQSWKVKHLLGPGDDPVVLTEHLLYAPTCNICGMWSGYQGSGSKTVLPAMAGAKLDFRLVPDQDPQTILTLLERHLTEQGFGDVEVSTLEAPSRPAQSSLETPLVDALVRSARFVYGIEPHVLPRRPGSGPMEELCQRYGLPVVNGAGVGYDGSRVHGPDEHIRLEDFLLNIKLIAVLLAEFAAQGSGGTL
jgi:acetylornithine deacetylase/succinyl-diaminopimelate desuccinylase-like protein